MSNNLKQNENNFENNLDPKKSDAEFDGFFSQLSSEIKKASSVLISTHQLPDGDGLGAELALYYFLTRMGKKVSIVNPDPVPKRYQFLDEKNAIFKTVETVSASDKKYSLWIILDTNDPRRVGKVWETVRADRILFVDHHPKLSESTNVMYPTHASVLTDTSAGSIGELLYLVFSRWERNGNDSFVIPKEAALGLYVSVMTDTNSFRYARTTPLSHQIAAHMIELGINPEEIYQSIFSSKELSHLKFLGYLLQHVKTASEGRIAWLEMNKEIRQQHGASADDTLSFLNLLLLLKDSEVICLFREEDDGSVRLSMRSKGRIAINDIAMDLGGGGHEFAAGAAQKVPLAEFVAKVVKAIEKKI